ncbi:FAD/FMN-containing dehydrogenase [Kribbella amoyensis]|uniref:FAD/FMN-containing dehydrogenase n=1 Tax=Kribbella amoyensis TaxID=996641 RepID=A0A561BTY4_9ACTN|nr:FAD-binding oxidoreductase [Kribbella amoyensis]TWD82281.1 FAD/FMN-containing dehydrogenase [Kribbella amoyensis]
MTFDSDLIGLLRGEVSGPVLGPGDEGFTEEVAAQNTAVLHTPDVAVGVTSEEDVAAVVRIAAASGTPVRVLATGHGSATPVTGGILVTTRRLGGVTVDPETRIAHIGAGCRWDEVIAAAAEHGLAPITGASDNVGCIGYTLGGGLGPLARTYGFSSDWARGFRLVTADGQIRTVTGDEHPDLFWALRGGKGGFGIVTAMDFELVELTTLYGGAAFFDADQIAPVFGKWVDWTKTLPETATTSVVILRLPPLEFIPEPLRGKTVLSVRFAFIGDAADGEKLFQPIRDAGVSLIDLVAEMPADRIAMIHNDPKDPGPTWDRGQLLDDLDAGFAPAFLGAAGPEQRVPFVAIEIRHLGGATARDVPEGSAVGGRGGAYTLMLIGAPDPSLRPIFPDAAEQLLAPLRPWISAETTINYAGGLTVPGTYEASWPPATFARLAEIRATYDPDTVFPYGPVSSEAAG